MFLCREELIRVWASPTSSKGALRILPLVVSNLCLLSAHTWRTATTTSRYRIIKCLDFRWEITFLRNSHTCFRSFTDYAIWKQRRCWWTCNRCGGIPVNVFSLSAAPAGPEHYLQLVRRNSSTDVYLRRHLEQCALRSVCLSLTGVGFYVIYMCVSQVWV